MISANSNSTILLLKGVFMKTCFCIGLGTATYCSYVQIKEWNSPASTKSTRRAHVKKNHAESSVPTYMPTQWMPTQFVASAYHQVSAAIAPAPAPAEQAVDPQAASPEAATEKKLEEVAKKDGESMEAAPKPEDMPQETLVENPVTPAAYAAPMHDAQLREISSVEAQQQQQAAPQDFPVFPLPLIKKTPQADAPTSSSAGVIQTTAAAQSPAANANNLTDQDLAILMKPISASFVDNMTTTKAVSCVRGSTASSVVDCSPEHDGVPIHSLRWGLDSGIKNSDITFSVQSTSGSSAVNLQFTINFKVVNPQSEANAHLVMKPTDVTVENQTRSGHSFKVYHFNFSDTSVLGNAHLQQLHITLAYLITTVDGVTTGALADDSAFTFTRSNFTAVPDAWNAGSPNQAPGEAGIVIMPRNFQYVLNLQ